MAKAVTKKASTPKKAKAEKPAATTEEKSPVTAAASIMIEDNIPIPATVRFGGGVSPYPFAQMQPGQSFIIKSDVDADLYASDDEYGQALVEDYRTIANRLSGACRRFTKRNEGYKFRVKTVPNEGGVRVWRVEAA